MKEEIFFDNSALSRLVEETDFDRHALIAGLRTIGVLRVSSLNVLETARTFDVPLRLRKLRIYKEITGNVAPMNPPADLLAMIARAHHEGSPSISTGDQYLYNLLVNPELASDDLQKALTEHASDQEKRFKEIHQNMRERFSVVFKGPDERFESEDAFLDFTFENAQQTLAGLVGGFYYDATNATLKPFDVPKYLDDHAPMKTFVAAHLHALWTRSVSEKGPGKKKAGIVDTDSAAYLNLCDRFITNDKPQLKTLLVANRFNPRETKIELYSDLCSRWLL